MGEDDCGVDLTGIEQKEGHGFHVLGGTGKGRDLGLPLILAPDNPTVTLVIWENIRIINYLEVFSFSKII